MEIKRLHTGPRMSQVVSHAGTVYTAGQVAEGETVARQTAAILSKIDGLLADAGTDKHHLISATIWITDMEKFDEMNAVWDDWVVEGKTPARACVQAALAREDLMVEIAVTAAEKA